MKYEYTVKFGGVYYAAGEEVPCGDKSAEQDGEKGMTVAEIKAYAKAHDIDLKGANKKDEMIAVIEAAENAKESENGEDE